MESTIQKLTKIGGCALVAATVIGEVQLARAGWTGAMNGEGFGQAGVNVTSSAEKVRIVNTTNMYKPSASINPYLGYVFTGLLPTGSSKATVAKVLGQPGYVWQATTVGSNGDSTDNKELEDRITIKAADCATVEVNTESQVAESGKSGTITVNASGTAGTAIWLRGFEYPGDKNLIPVDDENTPLNEFVEFLKANGELKWDVLMVGPFEFNTTNCTQITIPFTIDTDTNHLYFVSDAVAKSLPLVIQCPSDVTVACDQQPVVYPPVQIAGCGDIQLTWDPPAGSSFPVGINPVTVTATDKDTNTTTCTFNVVVTDGIAPVPDLASLPDVTGQCSATITGVAPTATDNCSGTIIGTTTDSLTRNTQGTSTVTWKFDDGHGNVSTQTQMIVVKDTEAPVITATGNPANGILPGYNPTAAQIEAALGTATVADNCGSLTPTVSTAAVVVSGCMRSQTRSWNVTDGGGNAAATVSRTATWAVDTTPPTVSLAPYVMSCTASLPVMVPVPTSGFSDNCGGLVTVSPSQPQSYDGTGSGVVWTFTDSAFNSTTVTQAVSVSGLEFVGFYSPINTAHNDCSAAPTVNGGRTLPIKFDFKCGSKYITGGTPPVVTIEKYANCNSTPTPVLTLPAEYQNDWHINWNITPSTKGLFKITVALPGGASEYVFIILK